jgi:hypothetical protein
MAFVKKDRVRESSVTTGTGPITLAGAPGGYNPFSAVMSVGDTTWYGIVMPGSSWETGVGTYTGTNTLARTTVFESSNGGAPVNFGVGSKDVFIALPASQAQPAFPPGTLMLFQQTSAPIYWTKQTTHNDKALRVVSGAASAGGSNAFSTIFNGTIGTNNTTITQATMASHSHPVTGSVFGGNNVSGSAGGANDTVGQHGGLGTASIGGDGAHLHTINMNVSYVDLIICQKD